MPSFLTYILCLYNKNSSQQAHAVSIGFLWGRGTGKVRQEATTTKGGDNNHMHMLYAQQLHAQTPISITNSLHSY